MMKTHVGFEYDLGVMPLDELDRLKGALSKSPAKAKAARENGKLGGREPSCTLAERLLNRTLNADEHGQVKNLWRENQLLLLREGQTLLNHFGGDELLGDPLDIMDSKCWRRKSRRMPKEVRYVVAKFRLGVRHFLKPTPAPKDYIVVSVLRNQYEQAAWERRHPDRPCPPRRQKLYWVRLPEFRYYDTLFSRRPDTTAEEVMAGGGAFYTRQIAEALVKYLRNKHAK